MARGEQRKQREQERTNKRDAEFAEPGAQGAGHYQYSPSTNDTPAYLRHMWERWQAQLKRRPYE